MKIDTSMIDLQTAQTSASAAREASQLTSFDRALNSAIQSDDQKKLYESCQQLESVFLNKVLDSMRACISHSDLIDRGFATETYESMLFDEYSKNMSKTNSLGIADILYKQLSPQLVEDD
ncbi:flagellar protein flgj [hydrocarbon metagenome]|uniref:Flagellar protein flgj n=1 Tax=hydrocarbon metagenome TaxID=938273 RepID=A0A0W8E2R0_9ZZZZ